MQIEDNKVVVIDYTLTNDSGETIDSSAGGDPLAFIFGTGHIIPGLEKALSGKTTGDKITTRIPPEEGYGKRMEELTQVVPREMFEGVDQIEVGMQFHAQNESGHTHVITVTEINGDQLTVDGNHALADMHLNFDVEVVEVRDATPEELDHGHVHEGPGGHQH
ncbi:MAG TPA: peptidylprolyl isomerase [Gammaproteobacteria bacterium]|nr:peptidylprolyl isomerase [Gammaproteobacteria bacterium]